ncbi:hypothetical protein EP7_000224 [Isosphaeraceae bacterium EP7]
MPSLRTSASLIAPLVVAFVAGSGCNNAPQAGPENTLHKVHQFTKEELNAPLSAKAKARGSMVAPPPVR